MVQLPPSIPIFLGAILVLFGALRAYHLGWKRQKERREFVEEGGEGRSGKQAPERRHMVWGMLWVAMGLFLIISTAMKMRGG